MKYLVIDLEMNPVASEFKEEKKVCTNEVIQIGAVLLNEAYQEIGSFMTLVKPEYNLGIRKSIVKLTGITMDMVEFAPTFTEAIDMFFSWCTSIPDEIQILQWSEADFDQIYLEMQQKNYVLRTEWKKYFTDWKDFQAEFDTVLGLDRQVSLKQAITYAGVDILGRLHDALDDARNTGVLLKIVRTPELKKVALEKVIEALKPKKVSVSLGSMFDFSAFELSA